MHAPLGRGRGTGDSGSTAPVQRAGDRSTLILLALALAAGSAVSTAPIWTFAPLDPLGFSLTIAVGFGLVAAGMIGSRTPAGRPIARLILVCAILYFLRLGRIAPADALYTFGLLVDGYWLVVAGHFIVAFPDGKLRSWVERTLVGGMYLWATLLRLPIFFFDERALGCAACPRNVLLVEGDFELVLGLQTIDGVVAIAAIVLIVAVLVRRWLRSTRPERRVLNPVFGALAVMVIVAAIRYAAVSMWSVGVIRDEVLATALLVQEGSVLLLPAGLIVGQLRSILARAAVANLLVRIGDGRTVSELERDIAWALGDPSVGVKVDEGAIPAEGVSVVGSTDGSVVAIRHDPAVRRFQPELLNAVVAATRIAVDNRRLEAEATLTRSVPSGLSERLQREGRKVGDIEMITISVLMSDIRDYTTLAESADLRRLALQLQRHRATMNRAVAARGGVVMQFVGDAVFAVFGAPEPMEDHALMAVRAALDMQVAQRSVNDEWREAGLMPFRLGIGVTSGRVAAALLGSAEHVEYSVVGDVVNLAQRLQGMSDGDRVVIDEATFTALKGAIAATPLAPTAVKGRKAMVVAYGIDVGSTPVSPI